ncbi:TRAP-type mannitol/chloroaromatic compound transport system substrate-binding protein [Caldalkalibacillus uzonensis]|uniref:TRAP-type mannitol/chloroaromatic compound transport system substrate-binding protein n=1 Tax=Caldalkalibacillus uzonensis TaxID=353224 RepID=A0ABU0CNC1_9BACI|nr:TRAP transporter substrate-binding protein DctP [Caldalkalibacillus uzonensis]MDQ0337915.1 TRAP-type mannitol/chloroaromatic compound transport system substrate-binding protein [Caldalkalibacillus uzonensis]
MIKRLAYLIILLLAVMALTTGCLEQSESASTNPTNSEEKDHNGGETFNWRMITTWAAGSVHYEQDQHFVDLVHKLSNGRININLHQVGELAQANQVLDMVSDGTVEMGGDWPNYWSGRNTAFDLLGSHAVGLNGIDFMVWIYEAGGLDMYHDIYGQHNTIYFPHTVHGMESGIRSNVPVESLDDIAGMNIRFVGLIQQRLLQEFGGNPVNLPAHEIYESLQRGVVDAAEFATPWADNIANLHEVTEYWAAPGWHQTAAVFGVMINKDAWDSLPDDLKEIVQIAAKTTMLERSMKAIYMDAVKTNEMIEEHGITVNQYPEEDLARVEEAVQRIYEELAAENPDFSRVLESQRAYLRTYANYREFQGPWGFGSNYGSMLNND